MSPQWKAIQLATAVKSLGSSTLRLTCHSMVGASAPLILLEDKMKYFLGILILIVIVAPYFVDSSLTVGSMAQGVVSATATIVEGAKHIAENTASMIGNISR